MNNNKSLFSIAHDHLHCLMLAQMIKKGSQLSTGMPVSLEEKAKYTIRFFNQELDNHFYLEEHILQPEITGINSEIDAIINTLVEEHNAMREMAKTLKDENDLENKLDKFGKVLEEHVKTEERILFPKVQESLSVDELEKLAARLKEKGYQLIY